MPSPPEPYDPYCGRFAADMPELDYGWAESPEHLAEYDEDSRRVERALFVREGDGTYNRKTGHFACMGCYIALGMPSSRVGWVAP